LRSLFLVSLIISPPWQAHQGLIILGKISRKRTTGQAA
jgi:hypothetical protein